MVVQYWSFIHQASRLIWTPNLSDQCIIVELGEAHHPQYGRLQIIFAARLFFNVILRFSELPTVHTSVYLIRTSIGLSKAHTRIRLSNYPRYILVYGPPERDPRPSPAASLGLLLNPLSVRCLIYRVCKYLLKTQKIINNSSSYTIYANISREHTKQSTATSTINSTVCAYSFSVLPSRLLGLNIKGLILRILNMKNEPCL